MAAYINTNISSLNAQRNLNTSQTGLTTALQRLSSGLRINSAKDDAAGLSIAERMTSQINGGNQATRNANDGISLAQTAEGDLAQIGNNLQRMRELAVQSANATNSASDRVAINNEVQALGAEIDRVASNSQFNGVKLLDGSFTAQNFQVGANATSADSIQVSSIGSARTSVLGGVGTSYAATLAGGATTGALTAGALTLNGYQVGASSLGAAPGQSTASAYSVAQAINQLQSQSGVTATANSNNVTGSAATVFTAIAASSFSINGINVGAVAGGTTAAGQGANIAAAINLVATQSGVTASADSTTGALTLTASDGRDVNIALNGTASTTALSATAKATFLTQTGLATNNVGQVASLAVLASANVVTTGTFTANASAAGGTIAAGNLVVAGASVGAVTLTTDTTYAAAVTGTTTAAASAITAGSAAGTTAGTMAAGSLVITAGALAISVGAVTLGTNAKANGDAIAAAINTALTGAAGGAAVNGSAVASATGVITLTTGSAATTKLSVGGIAIDSATAATNLATLASQTGFAAAATAVGIGTAQAKGGAQYNAQQFAAAINAALATTTGGTSANGSVAVGAGTAVITYTQGIVTGPLVTGMGNIATDATTAIANQTQLSTFSGLSTAQLGMQAAAGTGVANHGTVSLSSSSSSGIVFGGSAAELAGFAHAGGITIANVTSAVSSLSSMNVLTASSASAALSAIDGALATVNGSRASLGAYQNRFASVVASLQTTSENLTASRSRIQDTDFAHETAMLTRGQILQQAGTAMLAQANSLPNGVLALLR
jgi:flagellin